MGTLTVEKPRKGARKMANMGGKCMPLFLAALVLLAACTLPPAPTGYQDAALAGTWEYTGMAGYLYLFYEDGLGSRGTALFSQTFTWSTAADGGYLFIQAGNPSDGEPLAETAFPLESWSYAWEEDGSLVLHSQQTPGLSYILRPLS